MEINTIFGIVIAFVLAIGLSLFHYFFKSKNKKSNRLVWLLFSLRFIALFCGFLLLVNPKFTSETYTIVKTNLVVLADNSSSITNVGASEAIETVTNKIKENSELNSKFERFSYQFGESLIEGDSLDFSDANTDIGNALNKLDEVFLGENTAVILLTDGIQNKGRDYEFLELKENITVFPVIIGDTTTYNDLFVERINTNKYTFLRNTFPIEIELGYNGDVPVKSNVVVSMNGRVVYREKVSFNKGNDSKVLTPKIKAQKVGIKSILVRIEPVGGEKNVTNNQQEAAIEVIDEKTEVVIVADILHPDIGALKKAIETNEQRSVRIEKPSVAIGSLNTADIFILYQPNSRFKAIYTYIQDSGSNYFTITGTKTAWSFLNGAQASFSKQVSGQIEQVEPVLNEGFQSFGIGNFNTDDFPPLQNSLGEISFNEQADNLIGQRIRGIDINQPLLTFFTREKVKEAVLFGENIWRWRAQTYRNTGSFSAFDELVSRLLVYLSGSNRKNRLNLEYASIFQGAYETRIRASFFDKAFVFDPNGDLNVQVKHQESGEERQVPLLLKNQYYEVDLSDLKAGTYAFTVTEKESKLKQSGSFKILDFDAEKQQQTADYQKMQRLAQKNGGAVYFKENTESIVASLLEDNRFTPVQKSSENIVSLIDFRILLAIMALALALEWFIRKYNGLI